LSERPLDIELRLAARPENVAVVRRALAGLAEAAGAGSETVADVKTAVTEACMNAVVHAYPEDADGPLEVTAEASSDARLTICVRDYGTGIQPRPIDAKGNGNGVSGMRIGLPLIGALADEFEISGGPSKGTRVRITFDLGRRARGEPADRAAAPPLGETEILLTVTSQHRGHSAIAPVLTLLAARKDFSVDRIGDLQVIGDLLTDFAAAAANSKPLRIAIAEADEALDVAIGPLERGAAERIIAQGQLPGLGNALERIASGVDVRTGPAEIEGERPEFLVLQLTN
jgi:serine/threonine-protein kinase RsbW